MMRGYVDGVALRSMTLDANGIVIHALATGSAEVGISAFR
jgi:hypothetical protein